MAVALGFTSTSCARTAPKAEAAEATQVETTTGVPSTVKIVPTSITGGQAIIDAIKANYPNKVVLIDIWATWCPPCRAALKDIDAIKPTYQNKGGYDSQHLWRSLPPHEAAVAKPLHRSQHSWYSCLCPSQQGW